MTRSKHLALVISFILMVAFLGWGIKSSVFSQLHQRYITYKQIRFLDNEFHVLKSKEEIIRLKQLKKIHVYDHHFIDHSIPIEIWNDEASKNEIFDYRFHNQTLMNFFISFIGKSNPNSSYLKKDLLKHLDKKKENFDLVWDVLYKNKKYHIVFRPTDEEEWDGYVFWIGITNQPKN